MSLIKQTRVSLKGMTDEQKKEHKKIQMREYMNKRRKEDPEFAENCVKIVEYVIRKIPEYVMMKKKENNITLNII